MRVYGKYSIVTPCVWFGSESHEEMTAEVGAERQVTYTEIQGGVSESGSEHS